ncbi:MAG: recombinase family protein, partial [Planctomycetota bacterium]
MESSLNFLFAKRVILYIRVSTDEQAKKGYSLPVQMDQLKKFCLDYGLQIVLIFQEDASAKTFDRPEFNKFLNFVQKNKNAVDY